MSISLSLTPPLPSLTSALSHSLSAGLSFALAHSPLLAGVIYHKKLLRFVLRRQRHDAHLLPNELAKGLGERRVWEGWRGERRWRKCLAAVLEEPTLAAPAA